MLKGYMGEPLVVDFDHHSDDYLGHRLEAWKRLRKTPVAYSGRHGGFWVVSGYDEVAQVSRDEATFSSEYGERDGVSLQGICGVPRARGIPPAGIAESEADVHQGLRRVLHPFLLPPAVQAMRPFVEDLTTWFIDRKIESGRMDLVLDVANPVPAVLTLRLMGLPCDQWAHYAELFHGTVAYRPGSEEHNRAIARVPEMVATLMEELQARRSEPRDDMMSALLTLTDGAGRPLSDDVISAVLWNLVGGGLDTTTSLTSLSLYHLATHPDLRAELIRRPELLPTATEEFLRYFSVNETLTRTVTKETELGGQQLGPGQIVMLSWLSANHDETVFDQPERVVLDRSPNRHLAFGVGPHRCIGMHLARSVYQVLVSAVLDRMPDFEIDPEATHFYEGNPLMAGAANMPVTFTPGLRVGSGVRPF
jgi:cytochrome P450